jgi:hypothetical protein
MRVSDSLNAPCRPRSRWSKASNSFFSSPSRSAFDLRYSTSEPLDVRANRLGERRRVLLHPPDLAGELVLGLRRGVELPGRVLGQVLDPRQHLLGPGDLLVAFRELLDLHVHRPHQLVEPVGLDHGVFDGVLLAVERLGLVRHVLGQRVERRQALLGALGQLLQGRERAQLLLDLLDRLHRRAAALARLPRRLLDARVVLRQLRGYLPHLFEIALEAGGLAERLLHFGLRLLHLPAQILEHAALFLQRLDARLGLQRL